MRQNAEKWTLGYFVSQNVCYEPKCKLWAKSHLCAKMWMMSQKTSYEPKDNSCAKKYRCNQNVRCTPTWNCDERTCNGIQRAKFADDTPRMPAMISNINKCQHQFVWWPLGACQVWTSIKSMPRACQSWRIDVVLMLYWCCIDEFLAWEDMYFSDGRYIIA